MSVNQAWTATLIIAVEQRRHRRLCAGDPDWCYSLLRGNEQFVRARTITWVPTMNLIPAISSRTIAHPHCPSTRQLTLQSMGGGDRPLQRPELSVREIQVLIAWLHTDSKTAVGRALYITTSTVNSHLCRIRTKYAKVGRPAPTKAALAARAIQDGIVDLFDL